MGRHRTVQHKPQRDERKTSQDLAELKREVRILRRRISRLQKENATLRGLTGPDGPEEPHQDPKVAFRQQLEANAKLADQLRMPTEPRCIACDSKDLRVLQLPTGTKITSCSSCKTRQPN